MVLKKEKERTLDRLNSLEYMEKIFTGFIEMAGDRLYGEDVSLIGGIAYLDKYRITVIAQIAGRNVSESEKVRLSMGNPEGYRKSLRLMKQAEKFKRPIICLVDTLGAFPGEEAEKRGQAAAIANHIMEMMVIGVPVFSIIIGNGGSGGALALCASNKIAILENANFSVISPKGGANILWKNTKRSEEAAQKLKMTANDLLECNAVDEIIPKSDAETTARKIKDFLMQQIEVFETLSKEQIIEMRHKKFRNFGKEYLYLYSDDETNADEEEK